MRPNVLPTTPALSGRFVLRPFVSTDMESLVKNINASHVAERVTNIPSPYTMGDAAYWIEHLEHERAARFPHRIDFAIDVNSEVVGSVAFIKIEAHRAQVSMWLSDKLRGRGIVAEALNMLVKFGQESCGFVRIYAHVSVDNPASRAVLLKARFEFESVLEGEWFREGIYYDSHCYTRMDYAQMQRRVK